jgi:hypothetical protein
MAKTTKAFKGSCASAWGKPIDKFDFDFSATQYATYQDMVDAGDLFKESQLLTLKNAELKNAARAKEQEERLKALGHVKPTTENNEQLRLRNMYVLLRQSGKAHDEAVTMSATLVGINWEDTPEDGDIKFSGK